jgi:hypothetical protein
LEGLTIDLLQALTVRDATQPAGNPAIDDTVVDDAVAEAVLRDQAVTKIRDEERFNRQLEQLDRYLEDQMLVLKRQKAARERKIEAAQSRKERAMVPSVLQQEDQASQVLQKEVRRLADRIARLEEGDDADFQEWRDRLYERRYQRPAVERIIEVNLQIVGEGGPC